MIEVRRTNDGDGPTLRGIRLASLQADPTAFGRSYDEEVEYPAELWAQRAVGGDQSATFLALQDGRAVGMVAGVEMPDATGRVELVSMWTDPTVRRAGVGRQLVEHVVEWAEHRGTPEVRLWVTRGNDAAVRLYEQCGFELTDEVGVSPSDPCREEIRMVRVREGREQVR